MAIQWNKTSERPKNTVERTLGKFKVKKNQQIGMEKQSKRFGMWRKEIQISLKHLSQRKDKKNQEKTIKDRTSNYKK